MILRTEVERVRGRAGTEGSGSDIELSCSALRGGSDYHRERGREREKINHLSFIKAYSGVESR